jgi:hypothetical protein
MAGAAGVCGLSRLIEGGRRSFACLLESEAHLIGACRHCDVLGCRSYTTYWRNKEIDRDQLSVQNENKKGSIRIQSLNFKLETLQMQINALEGDSLNACMQQLRALPFAGLRRAPAARLDAWQKGIRKSVNSKWGDTLKSRDFR